jgi:hypothetical protein
MVMLGRILHDFNDVFTGILENEVVTPRVIWKELGHVIDLSVASDPATFESCVFLDVLGG